MNLHINMCIITFNYHNISNIIRVFTNFCYIILITPFKKHKKMYYFSFLSVSIHWTQKMYMQNYN